MGCGYLPTGYLPTGYLPIGAAATGGGSLRGKSAAAATLSIATSPAVTIIMIFMIANPLVMGTQTNRPSDAPIRPFSSSRAAPPLHFRSFADHGAARYNILNKGLISIAPEDSTGYGLRTFNRFFLIVSVVGHERAGQGGIHLMAGSRQNTLAVKVESASGITCERAS